MVVGAGSESYRTLRYLVERLPAMIAPAWLQVPTQPIAIDDLLDYLVQAPDVPESDGCEIEIGGPDVLPYGEMLDRMAIALGRRPRPRLPVPLLTPGLSALWIGLVTPVDAGVARPLIEGLATETTVTDPLASGREVILVDNAGVGRSTGDVPNTIAGMAGHATAFLDGLGIKRCDVLGYSLGGMVADYVGHLDHHLAFIHGKRAALGKPLPD